MKFISSLVFATTLAATQPVFAQSTPNTVVANVNGSEITLGHIVSLASRLPEQYSNIPEAQLFQGILDQLIQQELLRSATDPESPSVRYAVENEARSVLAGEAIASFEAEAVTEDAIKEAYEAEVATFTPAPEFRASHILVDTEEEAIAIRAQLEDGGVFAELAVEKSTGPSGPNGGDLGWFGLGQMVPEFELAVKNMTAGDYSDPVRTQFGWHLIHLVETRETSAPSFEERRDAIEGQLQQVAVTAYLDGLQAAAEIERPEIDFDFTKLRDPSFLE